MCGNSCPDFRFYCRVAPAFHQTDNYELNYLDDKIYEKPKRTLENQFPWSAKTATDGLIVTFKDGFFACNQDYFNPRVSLRYNLQNFMQPLEGFNMIVHSPDEYPVNIGSQHNEMKAVTGSVSITPEMFLLDDDLKSWPIEKRNCYLPGDKNLTFFRIYTKENCEHECLSSMIEEQCGCLPYYIIGQL